MYPYKHAWTAFLLSSGLIVGTLLPVLFSYNFVFLYNPIVFLLACGAGSCFFDTARAASPTSADRPSVRHLPKRHKAPAVRAGHRRGGGDLYSFVVVSVAHHARLELMQPEEKSIATPEPKLPWYGTAIILVIICIVALAKPFAPYGFTELALRIVGRPLSLDLGRGRSIRLIEETSINTRCQGSDLAWGPDGTVLVTACGTGLQAWTLDGRKLGEIPSNNAYAPQHIEILSNPFRIAYVAPPGITIWDVQSDENTIGFTGTRRANLEIRDKPRPDSHRRRCKRRAECQLGIAQRWTNHPNGSCLAYVVTTVDARWKRAPHGYI